jgi:predicted nucleic acid-binding protein
MPDRLVLDASAAIAIDQAEPEAGRVRTAVAHYLAPGAEIVVPSHFWLELVNVLMRRYGRTPTEIIEAIRELDHMGIVTFEVDRPLLLLAFQRMETEGLSAYDAVYLAVAELVDGRLLTLDARLAAAAGTRAVVVRGDRPGRLAETRATYEPDPAALAAAPAFVAYMAELRNRAEATGP